MKKYRKKPVVIEAVQYNLSNKNEIVEWSKGIIRKKLTSGLVCETLEGNMVISPFDFVIKGVNGEFYPCKPDIFEKTYEEV